MKRALRPLAALTLITLIGAGCSNAPAEDRDTNTSTGKTSTGSTKNTAGREKAMRFAQCMREHGVSAFPDPDASGELTIDGIANGSSLNTSSPAFENAISACKDLQPAGFTGETRSAREQEHALEFAQCMRDNGIEDFPDPTRDGPLIDTRRIPSAAGRGALSIPGFKAAQERCSAVYAGELGLEGR